jgi:predicted ABC-type ATPase
VIIIAGPNGAGKSTLAPTLLRDAFGLMEYVDADTIAQGLSVFQPEKAAIEAGRVMLKHIRNLARQGQTFAFESTLSGRTHARWLELLARQGYEFHLLFLWLRSPELAIERVAERVRLGGHSVPAAVVRRRYRQGLRNFFSLYQPLAVTWTVYDTSVSPDPILIATGKGARISTIYQPELWLKVCEGMR